MSHPHASGCQNPCMHKEELKKRPEESKAGQTRKEPKCDWDPESTCTHPQAENGALFDYNL